MINQYDNTSSPSEPNIETLMWVTRLFIILVGLGITLFGIKYTTEIFIIIYDYLEKPETLAGVIDKWSALLNIKELFIDDYPIDKVCSLVILAIGALLLLRITLGFIHVGTTLLINFSHGGDSGNNSNNADEKLMVNLDSKLNKLKSLAEQGIISKQAYENTRDKYWVQKIMNG